MCFKKKWVPYLVLVLMLALGAFFLTKMPEQVPIHWNIKGEADGYGSRLFFVLLLPVLTLIILLFFEAIPKMGVYKRNLESFKSQFDGFKIAIALFMLYLYLILGLNGLGAAVNVVSYIVLGFGFLFIYAGHILKFVKRNYFIGIRTPWTLADERVWNKTHKIGSKSFIVNGLVILSGLLFPAYAVYIMLISVLTNVLFLFAYSYVIYRKLR